MPTLMVVGNPPGHLFTRLRRELAKRRDVRDPDALAAYIKRTVHGNPPLRVERQGPYVKLIHGDVQAWLYEGYLVAISQKPSHNRGVSPIIVRLREIPVRQAARRYLESLGYEVEDIEIVPQSAETILESGEWRPIAARNPKRDVTRVRERGTRVTMPKSPAERIAAVRQIVQEHQYAKIDGYMVDGFSASAIVQVYDALNDANKEKYAALPVSKMAAVAFKLIGQQKNPRGEQIARKVERLDYVHTEDGERYTHDFTEDDDHADVTATVLEGGRKVVLKAKDGRPIVQDFEV